MTGPSIHTLCLYTDKAASLSQSAKRLRFILENALTRFPPGILLGISGKKEGSLLFPVRAFPLRTSSVRVRSVASPGARGPALSAGPGSAQSSPPARAAASRADGAPRGRAGARRGRWRRAGRARGAERKGEGEGPAAVVLLVVLADRAPSPPQRQRS